MFRSFSLPHFTNIDVHDDTNTYINNLQQQLNKAITENISHTESICILQNQLAERTRLLDILTKDKPKRSKSSTTHQKQLFYRQNKNNPEVIKKVQDLYGKPFADAGCGIPWQLVKTVTDKMFNDQKEQLNQKTS